MDKIARDAMMNSIQDYMLLNLYRNSRISQSQVQCLNQILGAITPESLLLLVENRFLTSKVLEKFITCLPELLLQIERSTIRKTETGLIIRGHINWGLTIKEQMTRGMAPYFVCNVPQKVYDVPSNRVLKWLLVRIKSMCENHSAKMIEVNKEQKKPTNNSTLQDILDNNLLVINIGLESEALRNVPLMNYIPDFYIASVRQGVGYTEMLRVYRLYKLMFEDKDLSLIKKYLLKNLLEPVEQFKLFEIYVLFEILKAIDSIKNISRKSVSILGQGEEPVAVYEVGDYIIKVRYQGLTRAMNDNSNYKDFLSKLDIEWIKSRCPDIILTVEKNSGFKINYIIEAKYSVRNDYILDSIYKMFGYFKDFEKTLAGETKGILVIGGNLCEYASFDEELWVVSPYNLGKHIKRLLKMKYNLE